MKRDLTLSLGASSLLGLALVLALTPSQARAQSGSEAIPYPDDPWDTADEGPIPVRSEPTYLPEGELQVEREDRRRSLAGFDDPSAGFATEAVAGLLLLESSAGGLVEPLPAWGMRATWELGRLFSPLTLREGLFLDFGWSYGGFRRGTEAIFGDANYHLFTVAPAFGLPLWRGAPIAAFVQAGGGVAYQFSALHVDGAQTQLAGLKPLFQYGVGLRGRPLLSPGSPVRLVLRLELTRYRRQYMDDTFIGGAIGLGF